MPYTMEDFKRDFIKELPIKERLEGLKPEEIRKAIPLEELLRGLDPEVIEQYLQKLKGRSPSETPDENPEGNG